MKNNSNNNNNNNNNFNFVDILSLISFYMQVKNIDEDEKQTKYINDVILAINYEIQKLHEENDIIISEIKKLRREYGTNRETENRS